MARRSRDIAASQPAESNKRAKFSATQPANDEIENQPVNRASRSVSQISQQLDQSQSSSQSSSRTFTRPGSIFRISLDNFMIYTKKTIFPGPHLNLILGPNGSGKSTLICAICLGLGGHPRSIGRMKNPSEFIKVGKSEARVEIELFFPPGYQPNNQSSNRSSHDSNEIGNIVIARSINAENHSRYEMGHYRGQSIVWNDMSARDLAEFTHKYCINVDNLCVLLAQDRVGAFAEMKPNEVLLETEKATNQVIRSSNDQSNNQTLFELHQQLIKLRKDARSSEANLEEMQKSLASKETELLSLEPEVARQAERETIKQKLDRLLRLKPWLKYRESTLAVPALKQAINQAAHSLKEEQTSQKPLMAAQAQAQRLSDEANRIKQTADQALRGPDQARKQQMQALEGGNRAVQEKRDQIKDLREQQRQHASRVRQAEQSVQEQRQRVANLPSDAEIVENKRVADAEFQKLKTESSAMSRKVAAINQKCNDLRHEIAAMESQIRNKTEQSSRKNEKIFDIARDQKALQEYRMVQDLLAKQRHVRAKGAAADNDRAMNDPASSSYVLKGDVIGPVVMNIDYSWAPMGVVLENALNYRNKWSYICSETDDALYLSKQRVRFVVHQNMSHMPASMQPGAHRNRPDLSRFASFGVDLRFAADEIMCDDLVMRWLHDSTGLARTVVSATELSSSQIATIFPSGNQANQSNNQRVDLLYTPKSQFTQRFSRYGNRAQTLNDRTNQPVKLFIPKNNPSNNDDDETNDLRATIESRKEALAVESETLKAAQAAQQQVGVRSHANAAERTKYEHALRDNRSQIDMLKRFERELQQLRQNTDYDGRVNSITREIAVLLDKQVKNLNVLTDIESRWVDCLLACDCASVVAKHREQELQYMKARLSSFQHNIIQAQRVLDAAKQAYDQHMHQVTQFKRAAESVCRENEIGDVSDLPTSYLECEDQVDHCEASLEAMSSSNSASILSQYARLQVEVERLREQCANNTERVDAKSAEILALKTEWLNELNVLVAAVNDRFSYYMNRIKCGGAVFLQQQGDEFEQWSLKIEVSFRQGDPMKVLSSGSQSGGEKSVATMLYLLSLQHVTNAPFRIVDEINQGMDPANERNVFQQIVHASTHGKHQTNNQTINQTPQYIVVTPKLLPGLEMPESSGVHCICVYGGEFADPGENRQNRRSVNSSQRFSYSQSQTGRGSQGCVDESFPVTKWDSVDETIKQASLWREIRAS